MTNIRLLETYSLAVVTMDWLMTSDGTALDETEELETAVRVALGTDRLADGNEILPDPDSTDRRGWWGDLEAKEIWDGWPIGCKNWLLTRAKITDVPSMEGSTVQRARSYTRQALQPFIDKKIATAINVVAERNGLERIDVRVIIYRGPKSEVSLRFQLLWEPDLKQNIVATVAPVLEPPPPPPPPGTESETIPIYY